jgi:hypothetical protein
MAKPGPAGPWNTGHRVPLSGWYVDQYGTTSHHSAHGTFPPCVRPNKGAATRTLVRADARDAA